MRGMHGVGLAPPDRWWAIEAQDASPGRARVSKRAPRWERPVAALPVLLHAAGAVGGSRQGGG